MMRHPTNETRAKMSVAKMGNTYRLGSHASEETKAKMSVVHKGNTSALGHHHSEESRAKLSAANLGKIVSPETRGKLSAALMGNTNGLGNTSNTGRSQSIETRAKLWKGGSPAYNAKSHAKRRTLGYVLLNDRFVGCEGHHVDNEQVIHMQEALHSGVGCFHRQRDGRGMAQMNAVAFNFLFKQEVEAAMAKVSK